MNLNYIKEKIAEIESIKDDDERAHIKEDELYGEFVKFVSDIKPDTDENSARRFLELLDLIDMAKEILKTNDIRFARWCA